MRRPVTLHYSATLATPTRPRIQRRADWLALRKAGFEPKYFTFQSDDPAGRARALADAQQFAADWTVRSGIQLVPVEGLFL